MILDEKFMNIFQLVYVKFNALYISYSTVRFLVSFSGNYLSCDDVSFSTLNDVKDEDTSSSLDHQLLKICVPHTESNVFGPAFIEVGYNMFLVANICLLHTELLINFLAYVG